MKNSNLKKALATLSMNNDLEIINPETVKGGAAGCTTRNCTTRTTCIIKFRDADVPIGSIGL